MGFRSFCLLLVAGFVVGCSGSNDNSQGPYSGANPNQSQLPPGSQQLPAGGQPPGGQQLPAGPGDGAAIPPTGNINGNPILNPSGVSGAPPVVVAPVVAAPPVVVATPPVVVAAPVVAVAPAVVVAPVMAATNTQTYFHAMIIVHKNGCRGRAFDNFRAAKLTNMVFQQSPGFDIVRFNLVYVEVLREGWLGYLAIDEALRRMGIRIFTCRL